MTRAFKTGIEAPSITVGGTSVALSTHTHTLDADWNWVVKSADENVTSSITYQDDDHLFFTASANAVYQVEGLLVVRHAATTTGGFKSQFAFPAATGFVQVQYQVGAATSSVGSVTSSNNATGFVLYTHTTTSDLAIAVGYRFYYPVGTSGGTLKLQWAQNASNSNTTTLKKGSHLRYRLVA